MEDTLWASLTDQFIKTPMAITAENLAEKYSISREDCDRFALQTQKRWIEGTEYLLVGNADVVTIMDKRKILFFISIFMYSFIKY